MVQALHCVHPHSSSQTFSHHRFLSLLDCNSVSVSFLCPSHWSLAHNIQTLWITDPKKTKEAFYQPVIFRIALFLVCILISRPCLSGWLWGMLFGLSGVSLTLPVPVSTMNDLLLCSQQAVFSLFHYQRCAELHIVTIVNRIVHNSRFSWGCCTWSLMIIEGIEGKICFIFKLTSFLHPVSLHF